MPRLSDAVSRRRDKPRAAAAGVSAMRGIAEVGHGFVRRADSNRRAEYVRGALGEVRPRDRRGNFRDSLSSGGIRARGQAARRNIDRSESLRIRDHADLRRQLAWRVGGGFAATGECGDGNSTRESLVESFAWM